MVRGKTEMKRIENTSSRQVTFTKRRNGLLRKAYELSVLCDAEIGLVVFSPRGKLHEFASPSMQKVLERYHGTNDVTQEHDNEGLNRKIANMKERMRILQSTQRNMAGEDLATLSVMEVNELEVQADRALHNIRARKDEILMAQVEQLKTQVFILSEENELLQKKVQLSGKMEVLENGDAIIKSLANNKKVDY